MPLLKQPLKLSLVAAITLLASACAIDSHQTTTDCTEIREKTYYALPGLDHGHIQSPINILTAEVGESSRHRITLHFQDHLRAVENLGHTVQVDFIPGSTIESDGKIYTFRQLHFHTPSEHLLDGVTFPMEMHIVNYAPPFDETDMPHYLVIGVLFKMGKKNAFIQEVLDSIPDHEHETTYIKHDSIRLKDVFMENSDREFNNFYYYKGSLTTPPYTESVNWFVLKHIIEASPEQIATINRIEGNNARHIQQKHGRAIE
ncbi:carbonic anhydrase family protein [Methylotuvimicrobium sp. KM1]|uniref:carbonic anhydrase family protein n=1 Tax=Methylotuvimicrobium sp. KM1 TaxID=3377707 RepID=UPI00384D18D0